MNKCFFITITISLLHHSSDFNCLILKTATWFNCELAVLLRQFIIDQLMLVFDLVWPMHWWAYRRGRWTGAVSEGLRCWCCVCSGRDYGTRRINRGHAAATVDAENTVTPMSRGPAAWSLDWTCGTLVMMFYVRWPLWRAVDARRATTTRRRRDDRITTHQPTDHHTLQSH